MDDRYFFLNSNDGESLLAVGNETVSFDQIESLEDIQHFIDRNKGKYIFTCLSYDLKNAIYPLSSENEDVIEFPDALFLIPHTVVRIKDKTIQYEIGEENPQTTILLKELLNNEELSLELDFKFKARTPKKRYIDQVNSLLSEIQYGNIYEVNYCQEFYADNATITDPIRLYHKFNELTSTPFSALLKLDDHQVYCGSPERFIQKTGDRLVSQPIKGTIRRGSTNEEDEDLKSQLLSDPKERSENVMIVDLVRNDLSHIATKGSVDVDELFGIYSFRTVHQMISTISCTLKEGTSFKDILEATFPMGSMTGAPKLSAMNLIEQHEDFKRGLYSGSIGYIKPNGDFDLNVVIRTLIHNQTKNVISCAVGSAITIQSDPEKEYEECNTKVRTILDRL